MAFALTLYPDLLLAVVTLHHTVTGDDILNASRTLRSQPAWQGRFHQLWDGRALKVLDLDRLDFVRIRAAAEAYASAEGPSLGKIAALVPEAEEAYATIKAVSAYIEGSARPMLVCASLDEALAWLGIETAAFDERHGA